MNFLLTNLDTGEALTFPLNPDTFEPSVDGRILTHAVEQLGSFRVPSGREPMTISLGGLLPGAGRATSITLKSQEAPLAILGRWDSWIGGNGRRAARLHFLVTDSPIDMDAWLERLSYKPEGGYGDWRYSLTISHRRPIVVPIDPGPSVSDPTLAASDPGETEAGQDVGEALNALAGDDTYGAEARSELPTPRQYRVQSGDTLAGIALQVYGAGNDGRYLDIWQENRAMIGENYNLILPGQLLTIPV